MNTDLNSKLGCGGPAFPCPTWHSDPGMELRDYFAGQALTNMAGTEAPERVAAACYAFADAMLRERQKGGAL